MKKLLFLLLFISINTSAQLYKSHDWKKTPTFFKLTEDEKKFPSVAIKEKYLIQYYKPILGSLELYDTKHSIIRVNNEKGIKRHNRVYIPMRNVVKVIGLKARVIHADGTIVLLDKNNIKELKDVKGYGGFKIFAIEGVEKDTQLEYIYTLKKHLTSLGSIQIQKDYQVREAEVIIRKPYFFSTKVKSYNGFPYLQEKKVPGKKIAYTAIKKNIPAMVEEPYATPKANRMKVVYLTQNSSSSIDSQWSNFSSNIQFNFFGFRLRKFKKLFADFEKVKKLDISSKEEFINEIAKFVNNNFNISKKGSPFEDLKVIYKEKKASEIAILKVYACLFEKYQIPYEVVLTSNRYYNKFDKNFFTNSNLGFVMFYFPNIEKFLCPSERKLPLGYPPVRFSNNNGIFVQKNDYYFKNIQVAPIEYTILDRKIDITVNTEDSNTVVDGDFLISGYRAYNSRRAYKYFKKENINKFKNMECASGIEDADFSDFNVLNDDLNLGIKNIPLEIKYTYTTEEILEDVGNGFMLSIGKVIGTQGELYQEEKRINPIELSYPNQYKYTIKVKIPDGYTAKNLEKLDFSTSFTTFNGDLGASFTSKHQVKDTTILITIAEKYNKTNMNVSYYEKFKKVINAAYDFSKKVILFEKK